MYNEDVYMTSESYDEDHELAQQKISSSSSTDKNTSITIDKQHRVEIVSKLFECKDVCDNNIVNKMNTQSVESCATNNENNILSNPSCFSEVIKSPLKIETPSSFIHKCEDWLNILLSDDSDANISYKSENPCFYKKQKSTFVHECEDWLNGLLSDDSDEIECQVNSGLILGLFQTDEKKLNEYDQKELR